VSRPTFVGMSTICSTYTGRTAVFIMSSREEAPSQITAPLCILTMGGHSFSIGVQVSRHHVWCVSWCISDVNCNSEVGTLCLSHCISGHSVCVEEFDQLCSQMHLILDSSHSIAWPWNMYVLSRLQALSRHT
jgi:hypothetical protein